ncbi:MAG: toprim domain-containing protein [Chitinophagales bacterium]|nr:toprim domain-containing protein [Chitinophagales bacterium]
MNYQQLINVCAELLYNYPNAASTLQYLQSRINNDTIKKFEFGFFPPLKEIKILLDNFDSSFLKENILVYQKKSSNIKEYYSYFDKYELIFPYKDIYGEILGLVGRTILSESRRSNLGIPKYKNTKFSKSENLFGLYENKDFILKNNFAILTEGQFDVIKGYEKGIYNLICVGSSNTSFNQLTLLLRYTDTVYLCFDNDEAGKSGEKAFIDKYSKYIDVKKISIPDGYKDIDEFLEIHSKEDFEKLLNI